MDCVLLSLQIQVSKHYTFVLRRIFKADLIFLQLFMFLGSVLLKCVRLQPVGLASSRNGELDIPQNLQATLATRQRHFLTFLPLHSLFSLDIPGFSSVPTLVC